MRVKQSMSWSGYVYNNYIAQFKGKNISKFVENFFIKGFEDNLISAKTWKVEKIQMLDQIRALELDIKELKRQNGFLKKKLEEKKPKKYNFYSPENYEKWQKTELMVQIAREVELR